MFDCVMKDRLVRVEKEEEHLSFRHMQGYEAAKAEAL